jgi:hypothetical protein
MRFISSLIPAYTPIIDDMFDDFIERNSQFGNKYNSKELRFYQKFITNYLHPYFNYKHVLLNHSMGSGKTRTAFMLLWIYYTNNPRAKILIVVRSTSQELHFKETLKKDAKAFSMDLAACSLTVKTMGQFSDPLSTPYYDLIIIDEIHMIDYAHVEHMHVHACSLYKKIERKLADYLTEKTKIVLMTGTPITRQYFKFLEIMNLILPVGEKFATNLNTDGPNVHSLYFDSSNNLRKTAKDEIIKKIRGKISTVKFKGPSQQVIEPEGFFDYTLGKIVNQMSATTTPFTVNFVKLSALQLRIVQHYSSNIEYSYVSIDFNKPIAYHSGTAYKPLLNRFTDKTYFKNHSALYYAIFKALHVFTALPHESTEAALYFNESIKDFGNIFFVDLLTVWGFKHVKRVTHTNVLNNLFSAMNADVSSVHDYKRVVSIYSPASPGPPGSKKVKTIPDTGFHNPTDIQMVQSIYSDPRNKYGKYIRLIVGGKMITQGYNFINARQVHIVLQTDTGFMSQAIARAIRNVTHHSEEESYVKVYRYVVGGHNIDNSSLPFGKRIRQLNMEMGRNSQILNIIDKSSVDCDRNKAMHLRTLKDYSQECNYKLCSDNFDCYNRPSIYSDSSLVVLNPSTDDLKGYYNFITQLFHRVNSITLRDLLRISPCTIGETFYYTLQIMIKLTMIRNRYGQWAKLKECNDIFYLSTRLGPVSLTTAIESITAPLQLHYDISIFENDLIYLLKKYKLDVIDLLLSDIIDVSNYEIFPTLLKVYIYELVYIFIHARNNNDKKYITFLNEYKPYVFSKHDVDFPTILTYYNITAAHFLYERFHNKSHSIVINTIPTLRVFKTTTWETLYLSKDEKKIIFDHIHKPPPKEKIVDDGVLNVPFTRYIKRVVKDDVERLKLMPMKSVKDKGQFCNTVKKDKILAHIKELVAYAQDHHVTINNVSEKDLKGYSIPRLCMYAIDVQDKIIIP